jgi:NADH-quinone oxidoreductase subunit N
MEIVKHAALAIAPELGMIAAATLLVLVGAFVSMGDERSRRGARAMCVTITATALVAALVFSLAWRNRLDPLAVASNPTYSQGGSPAADAAAYPALAAPFAWDALARGIQPAALLTGLGLLVLIRERLNAKYPAEHLACLLFIIAGVNLAASANDLIALFVALELISIPTYVLLYLSRPDRQALESTAKYFLLSIFSSAFLLYGLSFLLGSAGSTNFAAIAKSLREPTGMVSVGMLEIALALVVAGLGFRIAAVPFHFYAPDVFQGTTLPSAALLAIVPKIAGFVALIRLAWSMLLTNQPEGAALYGLDSYGMAILAGMACLTMTVGNVLALLQTDLRRLFAYSSVAHAGYMLVGVAVPGAAGIPNGAQAVLFYLLAYSLMTLGAFGVLLMVQKRSAAITSVGDLAGLATTAPGVALMLAVFMLGLTGLPPTVGFWGKFNLLLVAWNSDRLGMQLLAIGLAVNAAIAAWYYLRLVKTAYLDSPAEGAAGGDRPSKALLGAMSLCAVGTVGFFFFPNTLLALLWGIH